MKIAIFGGSFDPPHKGHIAIIEQILQTLDIDLLIILVAYQNPLKAHYRIHAHKRFAWMQILSKHYKKTLCSDYEIQQNKVVTTMESVCYFQKLYKPSKIYFVLGQDNFLQVPQWHDFISLRKCLCFVVFRRITAESASTEENTQALCEQFAKKFMLTMQYLYFAYPYASSLIVQNMAQYKNEIPISIRNDVIESYATINKT